MMIDHDKLDLLFGVQDVSEYNVKLIVPKLTIKEKLRNFYLSLIDVIKVIVFHVLLTIGLALQIGGFAYIAGIMFTKGTS